MLKVENKRHNNKKNKRNKIDDMYAFCLSKNSIAKGGKAEVFFFIFGDFIQEIHQGETFSKLQLSTLHST